MRSRILHYSTAMRWHAVPMGEFVQPLADGYTNQGISGVLMGIMNGSAVYMRWTGLGYIGHDCSNLFVDVAQLA